MLGSLLGVATEDGETFNSAGEVEVSSPEGYWGRGKCCSQPGDGLAGVSFRVDAIPFEAEAEKPELASCLGERQSRPTTGEARVARP